MATLVAIGSCSQPAAPVVPRADVLAWLDELEYWLLQPPPPAGRGPASNPAALALQQIGAAALPTLQHQLTWGDQARQWLVIEALGCLPAQHSRSLLEACLGTAETRVAAIEALAELGDPAAVPALRAHLAGNDPFERVALQGAMLQLGDSSQLAPLIRLGLDEAPRREAAARALSRYAPLRAALGFDYPFHPDIFDSVESDADLLLLQAAGEWFHEKVLQVESPWRSMRKERLTTPFLATKLVAIDALADHVRRKNGHWTGKLRVRATEDGAGEECFSGTLVLLSGSGHGQDLMLKMWSQEGSDMVCDRCELGPVQPPPRFPGNDRATRCSRIRLSMERHRELIAGLRTMLTAEVVDWWSGPGSTYLSSSYNFTVAFSGPATTGVRVRHYCGYQDGPHRRAYDPLLAAAHWHHEFLAEHGVVSESTPSPAIARRFGEAFRSHQPDWNGDWWWVRERMVIMAHSLGEASLAPALRVYLEPKFSAGSSSQVRTTEAAVTALAAILGTDLRFTTSGAPRPIAAIAADYLDLLAR
ncbi:MAG: hypothetical protein MUC36_02660 [Planctomycetes bacterium]|jgi:hypothetical protein|nr:hypothetical protein [Planctomycetota bacterium]